MNSMKLDYKIQRSFKITSVQKLFINTEDISSDTTIYDLFQVNDYKSVFNSVGVIVDKVILTKELIGIEYAHTHFIFPNVKLLLFVLNGGGYIEILKKSPSRSTSKKDLGLYPIKKGDVVEIDSGVRFSLINGRARKLEVALIHTSVEVEEAYRLEESKVLPYTVIDKQGSIEVVKSSQYKEYIELDRSMKLPNWHSVCTGSLISDIFLMYEIIYNRLR